MPLIKTYETEEATGELLEIYNEIIKVRGSVGNNAKLFSSSPELLKQQLDFIKYYSTHPTLSMPLLASIRICVSTKEECNFCIDFNTALLVNYAKWNLEEVEFMKKNLESKKLTQKEKLHKTIEVLKRARIIIDEQNGLNPISLDDIKESVLNRRKSIL